MLPVVSFHYNYKNTARTVNIGDYVQTLAVEAFYDRYFPKARRISLDRDELASYDGEPALVIMQGWFSNPGNLDFIPSPKLTPVFVGTHFSLDIRNELISPACDFLARFGKQEIGCRDFSTMHYWRAYGGNAYYSRCLTLTFPRRTACPEKQKKIFWVDVPERFRPLIPPVFHNHAESVCQRALRYQPGMESHFKQYARDLLKKYRDEAACVVTTAIHCAMPCASMGIPVLFIKASDRNTVIERWSALYGVIPVYTENDLENGLVPDRIPDPLEFEELKENILKNTYFACLRAMGQHTDDAEITAARQFIAEFNQAQAPSYESLRTRDAMKTLYELWSLKDTLRDFKQAWPYRIVWPFWKIYGLSRCLKENGWRYTFDRIRKTIFK